MAMFVVHFWLPTLLALVASLQAETVATTKRRRAAAAACVKRLQRTDFTADRFKSHWTNRESAAHRFKSLQIMEEEGCVAAFWYCLTSSMDPDFDLDQGPALDAFRKEAEARR